MTEQRSYRARHYEGWIMKDSQHSDSATPGAAFASEPSHEGSRPQELRTSKPLYVELRESMTGEESARATDALIAAWYEKALAESNLIDALRAEIERLTAELAATHATLSRRQDKFCDVEAERDRLTAELVEARRVVEPLDKLNKHLARKVERLEDERRAAVETRGRNE